MTLYAFLVRHTPCCAGTFLSFIDGPGTDRYRTRRSITGTEGTEKRWFDGEDPQAC
ncbi:MAG: hypothetical protein M0Q91_06815 [Methanoregula sp.]|nr:hypothetical protein [Methanoregula sp.]